MRPVEVLKSGYYFTSDVPICINKYAYDIYDEIQLHTHEFIEIVYVCRGKGIHVVNNKRFHVSKGDLYIINFDTPHSFFPNDQHNSDHLEVYNCMFLPEFIQNSSIALPILNEIIGIFLIKGLFPEERTYSPDLKLVDSLLNDFHSLFEKMHDEYVNRQEGYVDILKTSLCELLIKIYRAYKKQNHPTHESYKLEYIQQAIHFLKNNYADPLTLTDISERAFISKSYFSALFKEKTGMTVFEYLQKIRIQEACRRLISGTENISEIAVQVGYNDYRFFSKIFKKITGVTAREYRNNHQKHSSTPGG